MQQVEANQLDVSINKMREIVQQLRKQQGQRISQCRIAMHVGYSQDGKHLLMVRLVESTPCGNLSISADCSFHNRLSGGLAKTKVSREARQVPALYPIFKGFAFRFWFF